MAHELLIVTPDKRTRRVSLEEAGLTVGRAHSNDLCYPEDASLSRQHLRLALEGQSVWAEDLGSKNGTLLNGTKLSGRKELKTGDRVTAGRLVITLVDPKVEETGNVVFVAGESDTPSATVMTRLEDLLSSEATAPLVGRESATPRPGAPKPGEPSAFDPTVRLLLKAGRELAAHRPLEELFPLILDLCIEAIGPERGVLMVLDGGRLLPKAVHGDGFRISTTVRDQVIQEKKSLLVRDMAQEEAFRQRLSISAQKIHTMLAVPLQTEDRVIGLIYLDSGSLVREFTPNDLNLLTFLGNVAANRIEQERFARMERENEQAAEIQNRILPVAAPEIPGLELAGHNEPCLTVGGDYYDYIKYRDGRVAVVLGDVAGKGMSAALLMSNLQPRVQMLAEEELDLGTLMSRLDRSLADHCPSNRFITLFFGLIEPTTGKLTYCNAGHNPPLLVRASGKVDTLPAIGTVLGILPDLGYEQQEARLEPGDLLALFSDGVTETANTKDEEFGEDRLADLLKERREDPAASIVKGVIQALDEFSGPAPAADDVTLVIARRTH